MATFEDPEELIPCPYDPVHMVARKRMPYHIMKCRKNFGQKDYTVCPFNARHVILKKEFDAHISRCEDRGRVEAELLREQEEKQKEGVALKGNTSVPSSNFVVESSESWDDSSYVVEIKPQLGLFSETSSRTRKERGAGAMNGRPKPPRAQVSNPPTLRMPRSVPGTGSEVFDYSVQRQQEERQIQPSQPQQRPQVAAMGRGRGRGRGRGAAGQSAPPPPGGLVSKGAGAGGLRYPPGLAPPPQRPNQQSDKPVDPEMSQEERMKQIRKLKKMLRQLETLERKKEQGEKLDADQEAKLLRKNAVLLRLEQMEKLCESYSSS